MHLPAELCTTVEEVAIRGRSWLKKKVIHIFLYRDICAAVSFPTLFMRLNVQPNVRVNEFTEKEKGR